MKKILSTLFEQLVNSSIVGGIAALATVGDWSVVAKMFGLTFLIELRKYRGINNGSARQ